MNFQHAEKIRNLINQSEILTAVEKAEWLGFLELMNDKQLLELEEILSGSQKTEHTSIVTPVLKTSVKNLPDPNQQGKPITHYLSHEEPKAAVKSQLPHLGHILNMPSVPKKTEAKLPEAKTIKSKTGFFQRLSNIFQEKELPSGINEHELALPNPDLEPVKNSIGKIEVIGSIAKAVKSKPGESALNSKAYGLKKLPNMINVSGQQEEKTPSAFKTSATSELQPASKSQLPQAVSNMQAAQAVSSVNLRSRAGQNKNIKNLEELSLLTIQDLEEGDLNQLIKNIQNLVKQKNVHEALKHLEESPMYKSYMETGKKALLNDSFENLEEQGLINQEQFEMVADLLRQVKA